jgi:Zn-finger nucleic acid-binding protein
MEQVTKHEVVIDLCSGCGGMWLDKGELAKIVSQMKEAEAMLESELQAARHNEPRPSYGPGEGRYREEKRYRYEQYPDKHDHDHHGYPHRKKSRFSDLFDIFD